MSDATLPADYERVLRHRGGWAWPDLRELAAYRDLLLLLVRRDFLARYRQTVLGPLWMVLTPLVMTFTFAVIFSGVAKLSTEGQSAPLFYFSGLLIWNFAAGVFASTAGVFLTHQELFKKVYFPRLILPLAGMCSQLIPFLIQLLTLALLVAVVIVGGGTVPELAPLRWLWLGPILLVVAMLAAGAGLLFASVTAKYRDLQHAQGFLVQIGLYLTPVIYPVSQLPAWAQSWVWLNPLAAPVEAGRWALLGTGTLAPGAIAASVLVAVAIFLAGVLVFRRTERTVTDYL